ncbi:MAG: LytR/AlgR family response regulator transcription factor [Oscillospiraceae bacterium]
MLKIAICDDDAGDRERIAEDLRVYAAAHQEHSIEMTVYSSAFAMLDAFEKAGCPDIALLDICMPGMLGTELARDILRCSENTDILFLTTSSDYAVDAFALHAADYIQKPYTQEKLSASLDRVIALRQERTWLLLPCEGELHRIALEDVLYIETDGKRRSFFWPPAGS